MNISFLGIVLSSLVIVAGFVFCVIKSHTMVRRIAVIVGFAALLVMSALCTYYLIYFNDTIVAFVLGGATLIVPSLAYAGAAVIVQRQQARKKLSDEMQQDVEAGRVEQATTDSVVAIDATSPTPKQSIQETKIQPEQSVGQVRAEPEKQVAEVSAAPVASTVRAVESTSESQNHTIQSNGPVNATPSLKENDVVVQPSASEEVEATYSQPGTMQSSIDQLKADIVARLNNQAVSKTPLEQPEAGGAEEQPSIAQAAQVVMPDSRGVGVADQAPDKTDGSSHQAIDVTAVSSSDVEQQKMQQLTEKPLDAPIQEFAVVPFDIQATPLFNQNEQNSNQQQGSDSAPQETETVSSQSSGEALSASSTSNTGQPSALTYDVYHKLAQKLKEKHSLEAAARSFEESAYLAPDPKAARSALVEAAICYVQADRVFDAQAIAATLVNDIDQLSPVQAIKIKAILGASS